MAAQSRRLPLRGTAPLGLRPEPVPGSAIRRVSHDASEWAQLWRGYEEWLDEMEPTNAN